MATENAPATSGRRDTAIRLDQGTQSSGRSNRPVTTWTLLAALVWAHKDDRGGSERFRVEQVEAQFDSTFTIPYRIDMDPDLVDVPTLRRIVYGDRVFDIVSARRVGRRKGIELDAKAGTRLEASP